MGTKYQYQAKDGIKKFKKREPCMPENLKETSLNPSKSPQVNFRSKAVAINPFRVDLALFTVTRSVIDTGQRMIIAFLPIIARGLGEDLQTIATAISSCYLLGIITPFVILFSENRGTKSGVILGVSLFTVGYTLFSLVPEYRFFLVMLILSSLGRIFFNPSMQAYIGTFSNHSKRGFALSLPETGWSLAAIVGVPLVGVLIGRSTWMAPYPLLAGLGFVLAFFMFFWLSGGKKREAGNHLKIKEVFASITRHRAMLYLLATLLLVAAGHAMITIIYSTHFENSFNFQIAALGGMSIIIGLVELGGEGLSAFLSDRLKPGIALGLGVLLHIIGAFAMTLTANSLAGAIVCLAMIFLSYEFFIVALIPFIYHIVEENRLTSLSMRMMVNQAGVALGIFLGPFLYRIGWNVNLFFAAALDLVALLLIFLIIRKTNVSSCYTKIGVINE